MMTTRTTTSSNNTNSMLVALFSLVLLLGSSIGFAPMTTNPTHRQLQHVSSSSSKTVLASAFQNSTSTTSVSFLRSNRPSSSQGELQQQKKNHQGLTGTSTASEGNLPSHEEDNKSVDLEDADTPPKNANNPVKKKKKKGYQRAEEWDAEQKAGGMSWEQRVQFDGLRMGNGFRQNEILQKHLSSF